MLTPKQEAFCVAYLATGNASEAYRRAYGEGAKPSTVRNEAYRLLKHPVIQNRINAFNVRNPDVARYSDVGNPDVADSPHAGNPLAANHPDVDNPDVADSPPVGTTPVGNYPDVDNPKMASHPDISNPDVASYPDVVSSDVADSPHAGNPDVYNPDVADYPPVGNPNAGNDPDVSFLDFNNTQPQLEETTNSVVLTPDPQSIAAYFDLVFGYCEGLIPLRGLTDPGQGVSTPPHNTWIEADEHSVEKAVTFANWAARQNAAFYVIPGTVAERGQARACEVVQIQTVLVDLDSGDVDAKLAHLATHLGDPTAIVESGGITQEGHHKLHAYWKLSEPAEGEEIAMVCRLRHEIAVKVGGDTHFRSAHQPIRVAGSIYHKHGNKRLVAFRSLSSREFHLRMLADAVADMPFMEGIDLSALDFNTASPAKPSMNAILTTPVHEGARDEWTRFTGASAAIGHYIRQAFEGRMSRGEAWEAICQYNAAMLRPPWPEQRLADESQRLWEKHCQNHGPAVENQQGHDSWPDPLPLANARTESQPYPLEALPRVLLEASQEVARFVKVPVASPAVIGLSVAALAIGKKARIQERSGLYHHPALFHALIAASGERK